MGVAITRSPIWKSIWSEPCFLHPSSAIPATTTTDKRHNEGSAGRLNMVNPQSSGNRTERQIERRTAAAVAALVVMLAAAAALAPAFQSTHPLTGRRIANVMGSSGADWLERPERETEENVEGALNAIDLKPGMTVAEVGAGTGYVALRMAKRVGPTGKVYANDLQPEMLDLLRSNAARAGVTNVETVLGFATDPKLPAGQIDLIILVDVYHEFSQPQKMLQGIRAALKPDGRLVLLEYRKEDPAVPILPDHKMSVAQAKTEVEAEGFKLDSVIESLPRQHIFIFTKAAARGAAAGK
jgi:precorrin-6B methylase 2